MRAVPERTAHTPRPRVPGCVIEPTECPTLGELIAAVRRAHGLSQRELGVVLNRGPGAILGYEHNRRRPPTIFLYDLLDSLSLGGVVFNDIAARFGYQQILSSDPLTFPSIHEYVAGVRILRRHSRASFAATLACTPTALRGYEHRIKPDEAFLRRLVRRHLAPDVSYVHLVARFRTLRPSPDDVRRRALFGELRCTPAESPRGRTLRSQLIGEHLDLAHQFARRYRFRCLSRDDVTQAASEALIRAVDGSDPRYGDFVPYLRQRVRGSVLDYARTHWISGIASVLRTHARKIAVAQDELRQRLDREPTCGEIADFLSLPVRLIERTVTARSHRYGSSLQRPATDGVRSISETLGQVDEGFEQVERSETVRTLLASLDQLQRNVVALRYLDDVPTGEIATRLGVPAPQVDRILENALQRLRQTVSAPGGGR